MHIFVNTILTLILGTHLEKWYGSIFFFALSLLLILLVGILCPIIMGISYIMPEWIYREESWCAVGFSGVNFSFLLICAYSGESALCRLGGFDISRKIVPWIYLVFNKLTLPESSFSVHLSGIVGALMINSCFFFLLLPRSTWLRDAES